eukprot:CFRG4068T1
MSETRVALVTGSNTGIGLSLVKRLFEAAEYNALVLTAILACRNVKKAEEAKKDVLKFFPEAIVEVVECDTSKPESVVDAAKQVRARYDRLDWLYLNAGIMPVKSCSFNWAPLMTTNVKHIMHVLATSEGLLVQEDWECRKDLQAVFSTNVLGHYMLAMQLKDLLAKHQGRIIWTSSNAANPKSFDINNIQHCGGTDPYGSSKQAVDLLSTALNHKLNSEGVYSYTCCPGLVITNVTYGILPWWVWLYVLMPILMIMRAVEPMYVLHKYNGAEGLVYLSGLDLPRTPGVVIDTKAVGKTSPYTAPTTLTQLDGEGDLPIEVSGPRRDVLYMDPFTKYYSRTSFWGERYVMSMPHPGTNEEAEKLISDLDSLSKKLISWSTSPKENDS